MKIPQFSTYLYILLNFIRIYPSKLIDNLISFNLMSKIINFIRYNICFYRKLWKHNIVNAYYCFWWWLLTCFEFLMKWKRRGSKFCAECRRNRAEISHMKLRHEKNVVSANTSWGPKSASTPCGIPHASRGIIPRDIYIYIYIHM